MLVFRLTPPRERSRDEPQLFRVKAVRGGVEDAIIELASGPMRGRPFIVLRGTQREGLRECVYNAYEKCLVWRR